MANPAPVARCPEGEGCASADEGGIVPPGEQPMGIPVVVRAEMAAGS